MKYLLDTNVCIGYLTGRAPGVLKRLRVLARSDVAVCSVVETKRVWTYRDLAQDEQVPGIGRAGGE